MSSILEPSSGGMASESAGSNMTAGADDSVPSNNMFQSSNGRRRPKTVMLSWSNTSEMDEMGMDQAELSRSMADLAGKIIANGMDVLCATDPRIYDIGAELSGVVAKYWRPDDPAYTIRFTNYLAWPVHSSMTADVVSRYASGLQRGMRTVLFDMDGIHMTPNERLGMSPRSPSSHDWAVGLSVTRRAACMMSDCLVAVGGKTDGYAGRMPGVAEEVRTAILTETPVMLVGGVGGCARAIAGVMGIADSENNGDWNGLDGFAGMTFDVLRNKLSREENAKIARGQFDAGTKSAIMQGLDGL